jgi:chorismate mutase
MAILIAFVIGGINNNFAQGTTDKLRPLVETSARRLELAREVALSKWDTHTPVEDPAREAEVIHVAVKDGEWRGLDPAWVSHFFRAQIEANKVVQYSLLAQWQRAGTAPVHRAINLGAVIRPQLDQLEKKLLEGLANNARFVRPQPAEPTQPEQLETTWQPVNMMPTPAGDRAGSSDGCHLLRFKVIHAQVLKL